MIQDVPLLRREVCGSGSSQFAAPMRTPLHTGLDTSIAPQPRGPFQRASSGQHRRPKPAPEHQSGGRPVSQAVQRCWGSRCSGLTASTANRIRPLARHARPFLHLAAARDGTLLIIAAYCCLLPARGHSVATRSPRAPGDERAVG